MEVRGWEGRVMQILVALLHACPPGTSNMLFLNFGCSLDSHKMPIHKFHPLLHILIKLVWFVSWTSGLGSVPGEEAVKGNGKILSFHSGKLERPFQSKVLKCSNRPRGKDHLPALVTRKGFLISFMSQVPRSVDFFIHTLLSFPSHMVL